MGADCNGCGACCDPFMMVWSPVDLELRGRELDPEDRAFYAEHLTPIRRSDGRRMVGHWSSGWSEVVFQGEARLLAAHYYRCDRFDPVTRRCADYDNRPTVCRDYPWYREPPDPRKALPPTCSYRAEVGQPVAEMPVEWRTP